MAEKSAITDRRTKRLTRWGCLGVSSALALLVAELALRTCLPQPQSWMHIYRQHPDLPMFGVKANLDATADTGETRWRVQSDSDGLRIMPGNPEPDASEIWLLGDSFTFGYGVNAEVSFAGRLAEQVSPRLRLRNAAQPGYGPEQELLLLRHLLARGAKPVAVLLVLYAGNDVLDVLVRPQRSVVDGDLTDAKVWRTQIKENLHLYRLAARVYHRYGRGTPHFKHDLRDLMRPAVWQSGMVAEGAQRMQVLLGQISATCQQHDVALHVAVVPAAAAVDRRGGHLPEPDPELDYDLPVRRVVDMCRAVGLECLDLTAALAPLGSKNAYLQFDGHLSAEGHGSVAAALTQAFPILRSADSRSGG